MKNIHVLPTDKSSRLSIKDGVLILHRLQWRKGTQHIYITSDEEIKVGDWYINTFVSEREQKPQTHTEKRHIINHQKDYRFKYCKKIILTTDQDLINDGVQAINDDFLEWFVKNPNCEEVIVENYHGINTSIAEVNTISGDGSLNWQGKSDLRDYRIKIPKEEPKQEKNYSEVAKDEERQVNYKMLKSLKKYSRDELLAFGKSCFYKGFEKAEKDDANCYTAFREEIVSLVEQFKNK